MEGMQDADVIALVTGVLAAGRLSSGEKMPAIRDSLQELVDIATNIISRSRNAIDDLYTREG